MQIDAYSNRQIDIPELSFEKRKSELLAVSREIWEYLFKHQVIITVE